MGRNTIPGKQRTFHMKDTDLSDHVRKIHLLDQANGLTSEHRISRWLEEQILRPFAKFKEANPNKSLSEVLSKFS